MVLNKDYTVSYANNIKIGRATVVITGKGKYTGSITRTFPITVKKNKVYTVGNYRYKITNSNISGKGTVTVTGVNKKTLKTIQVLNTVKIGGKSFKVTAVGKEAFKNCKKATSVSIGKNVTRLESKAFYGCKALKTITIQSTGLKAVGKDVLKGISKNAVIKCPKKQKAKYKKLITASTGYKKTMRMR